MNINTKDIRTKLQELQSLDLNSLSFEDLKQQIRSGFLPVLFTRISAGNYVERVRLNKGIKVFERPSDLSYITNPEIIRSYGRANAKGSSIFYGAVISSNISIPHIVALAETEELLRSKEKGKQKQVLMTVSRWVIVSDMTLVEMVFSKAAILKQQEVKKAYDFQLELLRKDLPEDVVDAFVDLLTFFCDEFAKSNIESDSDYKLTAALSEVLFEIETIQGIIYPSVRTELEGSNVALLPATVDKHLKLEEVFIVLADIRGERVYLDTLCRAVGPLGMNNEPFLWELLNPTPEAVKAEFFATGRLPEF
ncbi:MAG: RES family NAD+ phosphorylase [Niabella sp.]|nr:RES family NAD+ phosphorylase [Niabella sp.]